MDFSTKWYFLLQAECFWILSANLTNYFLILPPLGFLDMGVSYVYFYFYLSILNLKMFHTVV